MYVVLSIEASALVAWTTHTCVIRAPFLHSQLCDLYCLNSSSLSMHGLPVSCGVHFECPITKLVHSIRACRLWE